MCARRIASLNGHSKWLKMCEKYSRKTKIIIFDINLWILYDCDHISFDWIPFWYVRGDWWGVELAKKLATRTYSGVTLVPIIYTDFFSLFFLSRNRTPISTNTQTVSRTICALGWRVQLRIICNIDRNRENNSNMCRLGTNSRGLRPNDITLPM